MPFAKSLIARALNSSLSLPLISTLSATSFLSIAPSSFSSHQIKKFSFDALQIPATFSHLCSKLSFLACLRSCKVCAAIAKSESLLWLSTSTCCIFSGGSLNLASSSALYPRSEGFVKNTAHELINFQNGLTAWPFSIHSDVSPPSCTKYIESISDKLITFKNSV